MTRYPPLVGRDPVPRIQRGLRAPVIAVGPAATYPPALQSRAASQQGGEPVEPGEQRWLGRRFVLARRPAQQRGGVHSVRNRTSADALWRVTVVVQTEVPAPRPRQFQPIHPCRVHRHHRVPPVVPSMPTRGPTCQAQGVRGIGPPRSAYQLRAPSSGGITREPLPGGGRSMSRRDPLRPAP